MATFLAYLDSGFGLLRGDVGHLTTILIAIDVTIAGLFWALDGEGNVLARLIKKVLYVGAFAFILNNFKTLADLIFASFSQLGLDASANTLSAGDLLKPGRLAGIGFEAAHPLLEQVGDLVGLDTFFPNFLTIVVLILAWLIVLLAFFVLAIQLFITVLEFKLTTLAGFVLVPFAFWNKTAFLAERVLGNVVTSGVKVMVLAVIVGIGSSFFGQFVSALNGQDADINQAMTLVLASLTILGLGIFGPGIASGLVSGAPQLGAGAALGTVGAAAGVGLLAGGAVAGAARMLGGAAGALGGLKAATATGGASGGGTPPSGGGTAPGGSPGGAGGSAPKSPPPPPAGGARQSSEPPEWARKMQADQRLHGGIHMAQAAIASGDHAMSGANPDLSQ